MALLQPLRGSCHIQNVTQGWAADPKSEFAEGMRFLQLVLRFDGNDHLALSMLGYAAAWSGDFDTAREMMDRAIASNPNAAFAWSTRGWTYQVAGNPEEAIRSFERAVLLSPFDPLLFVTLTEMGVAFIGLDRFDEAVVAAKKALNQNPAYVPSYCCLTTALAHLGREAEARNAVARLLELKPHFRISEWAARSDARTHQMFIDGLRRAGIPEWRTVPSLGSNKMMMSARSRLPLLARLRRGRCIEQCPSSSAKRKTYARNEFFSV
jgi:adenylate cyclase